MEGLWELDRSWYHGGWVGREILAAGGRVGEGYDESSLGHGAFEISLRHLRDTWEVGSSLHWHWEERPELKWGLGSRQPTFRVIIHAEVIAWVTASWQGVWNERKRGLSKKASSNIDIVWAEREKLERIENQEKMASEKLRGESFKKYINEVSNAASVSSRCPFWVRETWTLWLPELPLEGAPYGHPSHCPLKPLWRFPVKMHVFTRS